MENEKKIIPNPEITNKEKAPEMIVFLGTDGNWSRIKKENFEYGVLKRIREKEIEAFDDSLLDEEEIEILKKEGVILSDPEEIPIGDGSQKRTVRRVLNPALSTEIIK